MRFYGMAYQEVMRLPIRVFWVLNDHIGRIAAEEDLRAFRVANNAQAGEEAKGFLDRMNAAVGKVFVLDDEVSEERDEQGISELKALAKAVI